MSLCVVIVIRLLFFCYVGTYSTYLIYVFVAENFEKKT